MEQLPQQKENKIHSFAELAEVLKEKFPNAISDGIEGVQTRQQELAVIDSELFDQDILEAIRMFDIDPSCIEHDNERDCYKVAVKQTILPKLPEGYAYKGGAARSLLFIALGIGQEAPRDFDIIRIVPKEPFVGADEEIAIQFMADDYSHGDGVEYVDDINKYFSSRDLSINELYADSEYVYVTSDALRDSIRRILRVTEGEKSRYENQYDEGVPHKLMAKMIRLYAESVEKYDGGFQIDASQKDVIEQSFIYPFYIGVHLDRAFQTSESTAQLYVDELKKLRQIPDEIGSPEILAEYVNQFLTNHSFYYRNAPFNQYELEQKWYEHHHGDEEEAQYEDSQDENY